MEQMNHLFLQTLNMGITASYVIIAVLIIRLLMKRVPKAFSYLLWSVVAFRLICPASFSSLISIFSINVFQKNASPNSEATMNYLPQVIANPVATHMSTNVTGADYIVNKQAMEVAATDFNTILVNVASILWIVGIVLFVAYSVNSYIRLRYRVKKAVLRSDNIYESDQISSPFVLGIIKPRIYIPFRLQEDELEYILKHEQYHIRRFDHVVKPISFLLLIIYWFHPLVWIAYWCMTKDMEMSCDEKVLYEMGDKIKYEYSMSLLGFAANKRFPCASPLSFGETSTKSRIKNILKFRRPKLWMSVLTGFICLMVIGACATNPKVNNNDKTAVTEQAKKQTVKNDLSQSVDSKDTDTEKKDKNTQNNNTNDTASKDKTAKEKTTDETNIKDSDTSNKNDSNNDPLNPLSEKDFTETLYKNRNSNITDAKADKDLLNALGIDKLGSYKMELETSQKPYVLRIVFDTKEVVSSDIDLQMTGYATLLLALIDNVDEIQWRYPYQEDGKISKITCSWKEENTKAMSIDDIKSYGKSKEKVKELLDIIYSNMYKNN